MSHLQSGMRPKGRQIQLIYFGKLSKVSAVGVAVFGYYLVICLPSQITEMCK